MRCSAIRLTKKGHEVFRKVFPVHMSHIKPFFEHALTPEDATQLKELLRRLRESFRQGGAPKREPGGRANPFLPTWF